MVVTDKLSELLSKLKNEYPTDTPAQYSIWDEIDAEIIEIAREYREVERGRNLYLAQLNQQYGIIDALAEDCVAIYVIPRDNQFIIPIKKQTNWDEVKKPQKGEWNYNDKLRVFINEYVHPDDREELFDILSYEKLFDSIDKQSHFYHHFRIFTGNKIHYYYVKTTQVKSTENNLDGVMISLVCEDESKEREILKTLSETDIMTGLYNRGTGELKSRTFIDEGTAGMFCMMDMDHFKSINDNYGHSVGDAVIKAFAKELKDSFRDEDIVFRLGGDEFAVFAPGIISRKVGVRILKSLVKRVNDIVIPNYEDIKIEVSIGAIILGGIDEDFENIYNRVDSCVYISKRGNGNAITFSPDENYMLV